MFISLSVRIVSPLIRRKILEHNKFMYNALSVYFYGYPGTKALLLVTPFLWCYGIGRSVKFCLTELDYSLVYSFILKSNKSLIKKSFQHSTFFITCKQRYLSESYLLVSICLYKCMNQNIFVIRNKTLQLCISQLKIDKRI